MLLVVAVLLPLKLEKSEETDFSRIMIGRQSRESSAGVKSEWAAGAGCNMEWIQAATSMCTL